MNRLATSMIALLLVACGGGDGGATTPEARLPGNWLYTATDGLSGIGLTFTSQGEYSAYLLELTSTQSANAELEKGLFSASSNNLDFMPQEWTCAGPDPVYTMSYSVSGSRLQLNLPNGILALTRNTSPPATNFFITYGCTESGTFIPSPLAPVGN